MRGQEITEVILQLKASECDTVCVCVRAVQFARMGNLRRLINRDRYKL